MDADAITYIVLALAVIGWLSLITAFVVLLAVERVARRHRDR